MTAHPLLSSPSSVAAGLFTASENPAPGSLHDVSPASAGDAGTLGTHSRAYRFRLAAPAPRQASPDFAHVNAAAIPALPAILARLAPGGRVYGREWVGRNPTRADERPGSFKVKLYGTRAGAWADFATGDRGGDPVSLVAYLGRMPQVDACRALARMLGLSGEGLR